MEIGKDKLNGDNMNRNETNEFVGMSLEDVKKIPDIKFRVMMEDGEVFAGTCDIRPGRYNFAVNNGIITSVWMG